MRGIGLQLRRLTAAVVMAVVVGCAPGTGATTSPATPSITEPAPSPSVSASNGGSPDSRHPDDDPSKPPGEELSNTPTSPVPSDSRAPANSTTPSPEGQGWRAIDAVLTTPQDVEALDVPKATAEYLKARLAAPCDLKMTIFAAHPGGFVVGDESGICEGFGLFVYGPSGGQVRALVEFTGVEECGLFTSSGVPTGVPKTRLFPDGLVCLKGEAVEEY